MAKLYNLAKMTTSTTGTGTITLGSAVTSYLTFADAGVQNGDVVTYAIADGNNREIGRGTYTASGTTLSRDTVLESTNSGSAINLSGSAEVFITAAAEDIVTPSEAQTLSSKTLVDPAITGTILEDVYNLTGTDIDPANGSIQYKTLSANTTFTSSIAAGESVTLMIDDGSAYEVTWPTMTWVNNGGAAPTLATTGYTVVALWNVSSTLYGALVGDGT